MPRIFGKKVGKNGVYCLSMFSEPSVELSELLQLRSETEVEAGYGRIVRAVEVQYGFRTCVCPDKVVHQKKHCAVLFGGGAASGKEEGITLRHKREESRCAKFSVWPFHAPGFHGVALLQCVK